MLQFKINTRTYIEKDNTYFKNLPSLHMVNSSATPSWENWSIWAWSDWALYSYTRMSRNDGNMPSAAAWEIVVKKSVVDSG